MTIATVLAGLIAVTAVGEVPFIPVTERVKTADLVVVGKISGIKERATTASYPHQKGSTTFSYDVGMVRITRVLKSRNPFKSKTVKVAYQSRRLKGESENFPDYGVYFTNGDEGIWFLRQSAELKGIYVAGYDLQRLAPMSAEKEVVAAITAERK